MTSELGLLLVLLVTACHARDGDVCDAFRPDCQYPGGFAGVVTEDDQPPEFATLSEFVAGFAARSDGGCAKQLLTLAGALSNSSLWAVQMLDASAKLPDLLRSSDVYHLGHFDECVQVNLRGSGNLYGRYCLAEVGLTKLRNGPQDAGDGLERSHRVGVCVPNECTPRHVEEALRRYYEQSVGRDVAVTVRVGEVACTADESAPEKLSGKIFRYKVLALCLCIVVVSVLDLLGLDWGRFSDLWHQTAEIFSCHRNLGKLIDVTDEDNVPGIHFMRVLTICVLLTYRRYHLLVTGPVKNHSAFEEVPTVPSLVFDSLIFVCGFLTARSLQGERRVASKWECFRICAKRWLRLMPLYVVTIGFYVAVFESIGTGPMWAERIGTEARHCRDVWWANLSFINNYISAGRQCITQSWYLSVIVHCSFVTLVFAHLKRMKSLVGLASLGLLVTTATVLFVWNDFVLAETNTRSGRTDPEEFLRDAFIKTHNRAPSFVVGVLSAVLHDQITRSADGITRVQIVLISFMFTAFGLISIMAKSASRKVGLESRMVFAATSSLAWSLLVGCLVVTTALCNNGILRVIPTKNLFIPLSRLSYPALLVHNILQLYTAGTVRTPEYVTYPRLVWMASADVLATYAVAVFLHLIIEAPTVSAIRAAFLRKDDRSNDPEKLQHGRDAATKK